MWIYLIWLFYISFAGAHEHLWQFSNCDFAQSTLLKVTPQAQWCCTGVPYYRRQNNVPWAKIVWEPLLIKKKGRENIRCSIELDEWGTQYSTSLPWTGTVPNSFSPCSVYDEVIINFSLITLRLNTFGLKLRS